MHRGSVFPIAGTLLCRTGVAITVAAVLCCLALGQNNTPVTAPSSGASAAQSPGATAQPSTQAGQSVPPSQGTAVQQPAEQPAPRQDVGIQAEEGQDQGRFVFKKDVQEVVLHATVVDETGRLVTTLDRSAFSVFQNDVPEPITSFRREDVPVAMGIVIDNSGSMRDKRDQVNQAVLNLIRASNPQDEIFVVNFSQRSYLDQDFTSNVNLLQAALHQTTMRGSTALYDAVVASANHLRHNPRLEKKVLLVITDGQDNMSRDTLQEAMRQLQPTKGPIVYAIGLTDAGFTGTAHDALQSLATTTGGVAYFPESLEAVDGITHTVAHDIRSQYTLVYKPKNLKPGYQSIKVDAQEPGHRLIVRTRSGYYPGEALR